MKYRIRDIVGGEEAITWEDGQALYDRIRPELEAGREVELDFEGVAVVAAPFLNAAIGQLLAKFSQEDLEQKVHIQNFNPAGMGLVRSVIEHATRYYASPAYREAHARILRDLFQEE